MTLRSSRTLVGFLCAFAVHTIYVRADDRRTDPSHLTVMTLNAEFLWDGVEPEEGHASVTFPWKGSPTEAQDHMAQVAAIIKRADPDILNLCEVENLEALKMLNDKFLAGRGYQAYLQKGADTTTGEDLGLLTRVDPEGLSIHYDKRLGYSGTVNKKLSKDYSAKFDVGGLKVGLVGIHLLAHPDREDLKFKRQAQADAARQIALDLSNAGYAPIILGDFNDYDGADCCRDHIGSMPVTNVLVIAKSMDPTDAADDLLNACSFVPVANRYTALWDKNDNGHVDPPNELTSIDHMLIAPSLAAKIESVDIPHDHDPTEHPDHFPIVVRFSLGGAAPSVGVRIVRLLPNPAGNENENEEVTLRNIGSDSVDLDGWKLRDLAGRFWSLGGEGIMAAGQEKVVKRHGQNMAMNNGGDTIDLLHPDGTVVQTVTYGRADEGEVIEVHP